MYNGILLVNDKSYHDGTNNENSSQTIIVFNVYSMLRDIEYEIGLSLHILYYGFIKVPTICLYAKLIMSSLLIIFMFIVFRFDHGIIYPTCYYS